MEKIFKEFNIQLSGTTNGFVCPHCNVFSAAHYNLVEQFKHNHLKYGIVMSDCDSCRNVSIWLIKDIFHSSEEDLLYPRNAKNIEPANIDMPDDVKKIYQEASLILEISPRASAALSRLAIETLASKHLNAGKGSLNDMIGNLVRNGLSSRIQRALDAVRVIGNEGVHPGQIDISDDKEIAHTLLKLINIIVEDQITRDREIDEIYSLIPENKLRGIEGRDANSNQ
ncbi:DUF4145 domain-containing protein [Aerococcus urinaeequi]|uniref:DUF4145 domain-containing protein n=1 Tax=Aerococcus urinaeequi TaxID=51665 RepID=UPI003D6B76E7